MKTKILVLFLFITGIVTVLSAKSDTLSGFVTDESGNKIQAVTVYYDSCNFSTLTDINGYFKIPSCKGNIKFFLLGKAILSINSSEFINNSTVILYKDLVVNLEDIHVSEEKLLGSGRISDVEGHALYAGKKTELLILDNIDGNKSNNNSRQLFARIAGLNIWEGEGGGLQLGIGGRGLSPSRSAHFNIRQNGYDISADALGYPESYYTPPMEAVDRVELVKGAASLQYGPQFGGLVNFVLKKGSENKFNLRSRLTYGSWNYFGAAIDFGGSNKGWNYYVFLQRKQGNAWRENGQFYSNFAYFRLEKKWNEKWNTALEYTHMNYLSKQPGGLTDALFARDPQISLRSRNWFSINWNLFAFHINYKISNQISLNTRIFSLLANRSSLGVLNRINEFDNPQNNRNLIQGDFKNSGLESRVLSKFVLFNKNMVNSTGIRVYNGFSTQLQGDANNQTGPDFYFLNPNDLENGNYKNPGFNFSAFSELIIHLNEQFSIIPGIRYENIQTFSEGYYRVISKDDAGNIIGDQRFNENRSNLRDFFLAGLGVSYKPSNKIEVYGNFSQNYRSVTFSDLRVSNPNFVIDPNLSDEKGYSIDIGIRKRYSKFLYFDVSAFYLAYQDRIGALVRYDTILFKDYRFRTNVSDSRTVGLEALIELEILKWINKNAKSSLQYFLSASLTDGRYINTSDPSIRNKRVELVSPAIIRSGLKFKKNQWSFSVQYSYTAKHYSDATNAEFSSTAVIGAIPSYSVFDFFASYSFKKFQLELNLNNILNNKYYTRRATAYPGPGIMPSDPFSFYITLQYKL